MKKIIGKGYNLKDFRHSIDNVRDAIKKLEKMIGPIKELREGIDYQKRKY